MTEYKYRICLAMIVRDEAQIIKRCLDSVKPFVDYWVIHDLGSNDHTSDIIEQELSTIPGELQSLPFMGFAKSRNRLLEQAAKHAELILMIDADEELRCNWQRLELPCTADIGRLILQEQGYQTSQARIFRSQKLPQYKGFVAEFAETGVMTQADLSGCLLHHHRDGVRHRLAKTCAADIKLLEAVCSPLECPPQHKMALARAYLGAKQLEDAAAIFEQCFDVSKSQWLAHYLSAVIHSKLGNHEQAARLFEVCFDLDPDRAEPLMRLAEVAIAADNLSVARKLLDVIVQMPSPAVSDYLEPSIYRYQARLLAAELALQSKDMESAASYLNPLLHTPHIPSQDQARITQLKNNLKFRPGVPPEDRTASKLSDASSTPKLTVGMATYDDFHGVYFSIMSILLHHAEDLSAVEILVIDNNPSSEHGLAVKHLCERARYTRYIAASEYTGTAVRERVFVEARGDFVLCMDCHVLLHLGALKQLLRYINDNPRSNDLLHGPLIYDNQEIYSTHMEPRWNSGFYGVWGTDERGQYADAKPFEIPLQGLGLFACRRTQWPSFNLRFRGFGGEEGYIHEKFRQRGGKVLCLPFLRWTHRFQRPGGTSYENRWEDRVRNYLLGWREMGMDSEAALDHFSDMISDESVAKLNAEVVWEQRSVFWGFDTIFGLASSDEVWQAGLPLLQRHGIHRVCRRVVDTATLAEKLTARDCLGLPNIVLLNLESLINTEFAELPELSKAIESCQQQPESLQGVYPNAERRTKLEAEWLVAVLQPSSFAAAAAQLVELAASKKEGRLQAAPSLEARR